jgi:Flp pilus assembly CpaE family ATPase
MRHGCAPSESGPQFAPHFTICAEVGALGDTPVSTIAANTATLIATNAVVTGGLLAVMSVQFLGGGHSAFLVRKMPARSTMILKHSNRSTTSVELHSPQSEREAGR